MKHYQPNCRKTLSSRYHSTWSRYTPNSKDSPLGHHGKRATLPLPKGLPKIQPSSWAPKHIFSSPAHPVPPRKKWTHTSTTFVLHHCQILVRFVCTSLCSEKIVTIPRRFYELACHLTLDQLHHWQQPNHIHLAYIHCPRYPSAPEAPSATESSYTLFTTPNQLKNPIIPNY